MIVNSHDVFANFILNSFPSTPELTSSLPFPNKAYIYNAKSQHHIIRVLVCPQYGFRRGFEDVGPLEYFEA